MASSSRPKTADRQAILKKLLPLLKKHYKVTVPKLDRPVMETMLYAVCLENATVEEADAAFQRFSQLFPDLNEARVSSIGELEPVFAGQREVDWRAFRMRAILQYVFDKTYNFEFESLRKKTLELATKQLAKIRHISPFVRTFTLQQVIGAHVLPVDQDSARFLTWMGLAQADQSLDDVGESLKSIVRKAEAQQFCFSLRSLASDSTYKAAFDPQVYPAPADGHDASTSIDRLTSLFKTGLAGLKAAPVRKPAAVEAEAKPKKSAPAKPAPQKSAPVKAAAVKAVNEAAPVKVAKPKAAAAKPAATKPDKPKTPAAKATSPKSKPTTKKSK